MSFAQTYDARLEQDGWSTVSFDNLSSWSTVPLVSGFSPVLSAQAMPPIQACGCLIAAQLCSHVRKGDA